MIHCMCSLIILIHSIEHKELFVGNLLMSVILLRDVLEVLERYY